jgi:hypothetical protein
MADKANLAKKFDLEVQGTAQELGEFQFGVLANVASRRYSEAIRNLQNYKIGKGTHPVYVRKTENLFKRGEDLINAIEAKKNFPNLTALSQNKQEEIHQKALENFEDLKIVLRRIRTIERDIAIEDARSSIWVIKALLFSFSVILGVWFINEIFLSFGRSFPSFLDGLVKLIMSSLDHLFDA